MSGKAISLFILISSILTLMACGPKPNEGDPFYYNFHRNTRPANGPLYPSVGLVCQNDGDCPTNVGMLLSDFGSNRTGICTSFVYADGIMATNDHCIPDDLQAGADCSQEMEVLFAQPEDGKTRYRCSRLLWRSGDSKNTGTPNIDMAFYSTKDDLARHAVRIGKGELDDQQKVRLFKINPPVGRGSTGVLMEDRCRVSYGTMFYPYADSKDKAGVYALLQDHSSSFACQIIHGNSGSPVFDQAGQLKAVINSATFPKPPSLLEVFTQSASPVPKNFQNAGFATSSNCIPNPEGDQTALPQECAILTNKTLDTELTKKKNEEYLETARTLLDREAAQWGSAKYPMFRWGISPAMVNAPVGKNVLIPVPICSLKSGLSEAKYKGLAWAFNHSVREETAIPTYHVSTDVDENLRLVLVPTQDSSLFLQAVLEFNAQSVAQGESASFKMTYRGGWGEETTLLEGAIAPCGNSKASNPDDGSVIAKSLNTPLQMD